MLYSEITAVCSQIHTKHINTLCGQNVELFNVKLAVHIVTLGYTTPAKGQTVRQSVTFYALHTEKRTNRNKMVTFPSCR